MQIKNEIQLDFKDVLIEPKRSSLSTRAQVNIERTFHFPNVDKTWTGVPVIAANMDTVGTIRMCEKLSKNKCLTALHKHYSVETLVNFFSNNQTKEELTQIENNTSRLQHSFYSMGISKLDVSKFEQVLENVGYWDNNMPVEKRQGINMVCIDVANGYMEQFVDFCIDFRKKHPNLVMMAGNVVTGNMVEELVFNGVDIVKVGIGPGSACTTRRIAGVGRPQLSAVIETADAAHGINGLICSDGGCTYPADISKAFGGGADFVMLGGMLAGHDESEMEIFEKDGKQYVKFYGMSSSEAMNKYSGGVAEYRASEGRVLELDYRGSVDSTISEILGGLRSTCTYVGAKNLKELSRRTTFYRVSMQTNNVYEKNSK